MTLYALSIKIIFLTVYILRAMRARPRIIGNNKFVSFYICAYINMYKEDEHKIIKILSLVSCVYVGVFLCFCLILWVVYFKCCRWHFKHNLIANVNFSPMIACFTFHFATPNKFTFASLFDLLYSGLIATATAQQLTSIDTVRCSITHSTSGSHNAQSK